MVSIQYLEFGNRLDQGTFDFLIRVLPHPMAEQILRYRRWEDRQASLFGKLLLLEALRKANIRVGLSAVCYTAYKRPFLAEGNEIDFNITHTDHCVVCALSTTCRVGIDVEKIKPIGVDEFKCQFCEREWNVIHASHDKYTAFYNYWTRKEAVIKADGRGLTIRLNEIDVESDTVQLDDKKWYLKRIQIVKGHIAHVATDVFLFDNQISLQGYSIREIVESCVRLHASVMPD